MFDPMSADAGPRLRRAFHDLKLRASRSFRRCKIPLDDPCVDAVFKTAEEERAVVFAHAAC